jgi:hypothetical protein
VVTTCLPDSMAHFTCDTAGSPSTGLVKVASTTMSAGQPLPDPARRLLPVEGKRKKSTVSLPPAVDRAAAAAIRRNERVVIEAALATASKKDLEFLHAMAVDESTSTAADIVRRTGSKPTLVAKYRTRLQAAGLIE